MADQPVTYTYRIQLVELDEHVAKFGPTLGEPLPVLSIDTVQWVNMGRPGELEIEPKLTGRTPDA